MADNEKTTDIIEFQIKEFIESIRPPVEIRNEVDMGYTYKKFTLELFEIRPKWDDESVKINGSIAKTRFVKTQGVWKIYWKRANGKWVSYTPNPEVKTINEFFTIVKNDEYACFFG